jgi:hypothetical protein
MLAAGPSLDPGRLAVVIRRDALTGLLTSDRTSMFRRSRGSGRGTRSDMGIPAVSTPFTRRALAENVHILILVLLHLVHDHLVHDTHLRE